MDNAAAAQHTETEGRSLCGGLSSIDAIAAEWRALCEEGPSNQPFYRPEWFQCFLQAFSPDAKLRLLTVRQNGKLRAVLPLIEQHWGPPGFRKTLLRSPTNVHSNRFDIVVGAMDSAAAIQTLWQTLKSDRTWDILRLEDVPEGGHAERLLELAQTDGYPGALWESMRTPYIQFSGTPRSVEEALGKTDSNFFSNLKKKYKKLEKSGSVYLERITAGQAGILDQFYALEAAGWKGREGSAIQCEPDTKRFYDALAEAASRNHYLDLRGLRCGDDYAAINYSFTLNSKHYIPKTAYSEKYSQSSPGQLIMREVIRSCLAEGIEEFDFLGPWAPWKSHWASSTRIHSHVIVYRNNLLGKIAHVVRFQGLTRLRRARRAIREYKMRRASRPQK